MGQTSNTLFVYKMTWLLLVTGILCGLFCVVSLASPGPMPGKSLQCRRDAFQAVQEDNSLEMIVEICHDGEWKRVCRDDNSKILASAVCKQMLYSSGGETVLAASA